MNEAQEYLLELFKGGIEIINPGNEKDAIENFYKWIEEYQY